MIKAAGIILAFLASALAGIMKSWEIKQRKEILENFRELITLISTRIGYFKEPLPVIFQSLALEMENEGSVFLRHFLMYCEMEDKDLKTIWEKAVTAVYEPLPLSNEDIRLLCKCGQFLGQSDYESQIKHFNLLNSQLDREIKYADEVAKTKGVMYSRTGVAVGVLIAIALT